VALGSEQSTSLRIVLLAATASANDFAAYAWRDGDSGNADILAQNLNPDGTLGAQSLFADGFESGDTTAWSATMP